MAKKISELSAAASLVGTELVAVVQSGNTVKTTVDDIRGVGISGRNTTNALSIASGVANINYNNGDYHTLALNANVTSITFSNLPGSGKAATLMVLITQDTTPRTVAFPSSFKWEGGTVGVVSTGSGVKDLLAITTFDNGTTWHATLSKGRA